MFIVIYDDGDGLNIPYTWDGDCEGSLVCRMSDQPAAVFPDRNSARRAINISAKYAALCKAQGRPDNEDFTTHRECVKIVPLKGAKNDER